MPALTTTAIDSGSYNGLSWGPGTSFHVASVEGFDDLPEVRAADAERAFDHGAFPGQDTMATRTISLTLSIIATTNAAYTAAAHALRAATTVQTAESPLLLFGSQRLLKARVRRRAIPYDGTTLQRVSVATLEFVCTDPRIYDATLSSGTSALAQPTGGMSFPLSFPFSFGTAGTSGAISAVNEGNFATRPTCVIYGPVSNPRIENVTSGETVRFLITLAAGEFLTVDFDTRSVLLNGTASRRSTMTNDSTWWELAPGTSQVNYQADTYVSGSTMTMTFRSAWV